MKFKSYTSNEHGQVVAERVVELTEEEVATIEAATPSEEECTDVLQHFKATNPEKDIEILTIDLFPLAEYIED